MPSNEGHDLDGVVDYMIAHGGVVDGKSVWLDDMQYAAVPAWSQLRSHPPGASCECPVGEVLAAMHERGWRFHRITEEEAAMERAAGLIADAT